MIMAWNYFHILSANTKIMIAEVLISRMKLKGSVLVSTHNLQQRIIQCLLPC